MDITLVTFCARVIYCFIKIGSGVNTQTDPSTLGASCSRATDQTPLNQTLVSPTFATSATDTEVPQDLAENLNSTYHVIAAPDYAVHLSEEINGLKLEVQGNCCAFSIYYK